MRIVADDLTHPDVLDLLRFHLAEAGRNSPEGCVFALDVDGLRAPGTVFWTAWDGDALLGMAALKDMEPGHGELKSMRTVSGRQGEGIGQALLGHAIAAARARGMVRLSLETGDNEPFAAARRLYERAGFTPCPPFADYRAGSFNTFYTLVL